MSEPFTKEDLTAMRNEGGYTRDQAATLVGVTARSWKSWELGQRPIPDGLREKFMQAHFAAEDLRLDALAERELEERRASLAKIQVRANPNSPQPTAGAARTGVPPLPRFTHLNHIPTQEEEDAQALDLANGMTMTGAEVAEALAQFNQEQATLLSASAIKTAQAMRDYTKASQD